MARTKLDITITYQLASATTAVITIVAPGEGQIFFNDVNSDDIAAHKVTRMEVLNKKGMQIQQLSIADTYVRATGDGWKIIIDEG